MDLTSDCDINTHIRKIELKDKPFIYIKLNWIQNKEDLFNIQVIDRESSWSGRFSNEFALQFRQRDNIDETEEEYVANVQNCLITGDENYTYDFSISSDIESASSNEITASFSWKRKCKGAIVLQGKVLLHRDDLPQTKDTLVDILITKNMNLQSNIKKLTTETDQLHNELNKCKDELEKYVNLKTSLESTLYGKFVQLLNSKKKQIQQLEDDLHNFEEPSNVLMSDDLD